MPSCVKSLKPERATHVACGKAHTIVSTFSGKVFAFGNNLDCQLGLGDTEERSSPTEVTGIAAGEDGVRMLAAGCQHSAVLTADGGVYVWGSNSDGQLGLGDSVSVVDSPKRIDISYTIIYISCGYYHSALVTEEGKLLMCGEGENGKLGLSRENRNMFVPTPVNISVPIRSVACGGNHTIAVSMDGDVYGFGSNLSGQLGLGRRVLSYSVPECIETLLGKHICAAACGEIHTAFLTVEGHMYACGDGRHGKLCIEIENGDEGSVQCTPQFVSRFSQYRVKQVACGGCHTMVQALLETDMSQSDSDGIVNGDVSLRLQKVESIETDNSPISSESHARVLPPLQNAPLLNGIPEKSETNDVSDKEPDSPQKENDVKREDLPSTTPPDIIQTGETKTDPENVLNGHVDEETEPEKSDVNDSSEHDVQSNSVPQDSHKIVNGHHQTQSLTENGTQDSEEKLEASDEKDLFSKYNLRDASDLTNGENGNEGEQDELDSPKTINAESGKEAEEKMDDDRRCSVDITPTLTDGVDLDSEDGNIISGGDQIGNNQNIMASIDKGEGRVAKFLNAFRRKKLSEENVSVNAAWADVDRRISSENNLKNGKRPSQPQLRSGQVHKSKACVIL